MKAAPIRDSSAERRQQGQILQAKAAVRPRSGAEARERSAKPRPRRPRSSLKPSPRATSLPSTYFIASNYIKAFGQFATRQSESDHIAIEATSLLAPARRHRRDCESNLRRERDVLAQAARPPRFGAVGRADAAAGHAAAVHAAMMDVSTIRKSMPWLRPDGWVPVFLGQTQAFARRSCCDNYGKRLSETSYHPSAPGLADLRFVLMALEVAAPGILPVSARTGGAVGWAAVVCDPSIWQTQLLMFAVFAAAAIPIARLAHSDTSVSASNPFLNKGAATRWSDRVSTLEKPIIDRWGTVRSATRSGASRVRCAGR